MAMIVKELLQVGQRALEVAGIYDAKVDAEQLLCYMLHVDKAGLFMIWSRMLDDSQCNTYFDLIDRRATRLPLQYITGIQEFMGYPFMVNEKVLIPRLDTEILAEAAMDYSSHFKKKVHLLDLCCGSGAIGISLDKICKNMKVTCCDISDDAIELARKNAKLLKSNVSFALGDLFEPFKKKLGNTRFDIIVSNPPYIESSIIPTLDKEVREYEPHLALDGGNDGLDFYRRIIEEAPNYLREHGMLLFEIGYDQGRAVEELAILRGPFVSVEIKKDHSGLDRVAICRS
ncbi:peptide chain release factor N(5)-glutamine methyltransferase [Clostridium aminobutyricum]|uniref:Release factor glutamine methyltransferase n=1 Tax=Clostridium aminobutyricum TaxID=33953 RepID=A0A939D9S3_CLOAM|nr:peptide chain release factor N(5)-glutamine methyltransferase [Clostridium aminobutyricum]MBN7774024.1 peptide chain release factor N(5)-glutamine methyltransferase [Clostridium aminobutyricum]